MTIAPVPATSAPIAHGVTHLGHRIHVDEYAGVDPPVVLLHGFPDNRHLYDRLVPHLAPRRVLAVDFLGWGASGKPDGHPRTAHDQTAEVAAVVDALSPDGPVVLVAHDSSGPPAIDYALLHPARVAALVLLNTYYAASRALRAPEAITLYSTPGVRRVARVVARVAPAVDRRLFLWQVGRFVLDARERAILVPALHRDFVAARPAFWRLTADLPATLRDRRHRLPDLARLPVPVHVVFGAGDPYLNPRVARELAAWFGVAPVLVPDAGHYVQVDAPEVVASHVLAVGRR